jgi:hypothetical protein
MFSVSGTGDFSSTVLKGPRIISLMHRFSFHMDPVLDKFYSACFFVCAVFMFHTMACDVYSFCSPKRIVQVVLHFTKRW